MSEELPEYKLTFIKEMDEMRRKQQQEEELKTLQQTSNIQLQGQEPAANVQHQSWNQSQYSDANWRSQLTQSFYRTEHNDNQFQMNNLLNPEIARKKHNVRVTQISEYSNAKHNNTVFLNPKHSSC